MLAPGSVHDPQRADPTPSPQVPAQQIEEELYVLEEQVQRGQLDHLPLRARQQVFHQIDDLRRQLAATQASDQQYRHDEHPRAQTRARTGRFERFRNTWNASPGFRQFAYGCAAAAAIFSWYNQEYVPITNRRRFNFVSKDWEQQLGMVIYESVIEQYKNQLLPDSDPRTKMVRRVIGRLAPASGLDDWEIHVIDDRSQRNAFVSPGGEVFVFSGLLPICRTEAGLAAVLSHEIAHVVARHAAERMSVSLNVFGVWITSLAFWDLGLVSIWLLNRAAGIAFNLPASRLEETEADQIGLILMARSCYDPSNAIGLWERMLQAETVAPPEWLSTHPSTFNRIENIKRWLPKAQEEGVEAGCGRLKEQAQAFADAQGPRSTFVSRR